MAALAVPTPFENVEKAFEIGVGIDMGMVDRMADAGLASHVNHMRKSLLGEQRRDAGPIRKIGMNEFESLLLPQQIEPRLLERWIVEVVDVVEAYDVAAFGQQPTRDVKADESSGARDQYGLFRHPVPELAGSACPAGGACLAALARPSQ